MTEERQVGQPLDANLPPNEASPFDTIPSSDVHRYRAVRKLGQGNMGAVYLAEDTRLGRQVALKVPHFRPDDGAEVRARFLREARALASVHHPNICQIFD